MNLDPQCLFDQLNAACTFNKDACVRVAYSGGADSTVLLHLLSRLQQTVEFSLVALHVNHGINVDSDSWEKHCAEFCQSLNIRFHSTRLQLESSEGRVSESKARVARYGWLHSQLNAGELLLTAHHREDQVETFMLNLMRAAGPRGLSAIQSKQKFGDGWLMRPLLSVSKSAILEYVASWNLSYIEDPANHNLDYDRNHLRHVVLPAMAQRWPAAHRQIASSIENLEQSRHLLDNLATLDVDQCRSQAHSYLSAAQPLCVNQLKCLNKSRQINLIRYWSRKFVGCEPGRQALDQFIHTVLVLDKRFAELAWGNQRIYRYQDSLFLTHATKLMQSTHEVYWDLRETIALHQAGVRLIPTSTPGAGLSLEKLLRPVSVRFREGAERITLPGRQHSSSLKKLFQHDSIPPWERGSLPLIFSGTNLAAVVPWIVAGPFKAKENESGITIRLEKL